MDTGQQDLDIKGISVSTEYNEMEGARSCSSTFPNDKMLNFSIRSSYTMFFNFVETDSLQWANKWSKHYILDRMVQICPTIESSIWRFEPRTIVRSWVRIL